MYGGLKLHKTMRTGWFGKTNIENRVKIDVPTENWQISTAGMMIDQYVV